MNATRRVKDEHEDGQRIDECGQLMMNWWHMETCHKKLLQLPQQRDNDRDDEQHDDQLDDH